ncbi:hypothetical protein Ahy_A04g021486 isoform A [Arachis hypogaea]|uniref:Secreted protein n=1 Tax=Arachis hypogaea TaxID=3818 RepID=A0A445DKL3_ARAHY|nr:hypothetical protein Ahy_A04g021486 isoform A [Arachis hypogaea]
MRAYQILSLLLANSAVVGAASVACRVLMDSQICTFYSCSTQIYALEDHKTSKMGFMFLVNVRV